MIGTFTVPLEINGSDCSATQQCYSPTKKVGSQCVPRKCKLDETKFPPRLLRTYSVYPVLCV